MPDLSNEEMKMPENNGSQSTGNAAAATPVNGAIIGVLVLLLIMILGGMYYWFSQLTQEVAPAVEPTFERPSAEENNEPESTTAEAAVEALNSLSTSDELAAIEADIAATDLSAIDTELTAIQAELDAALAEDPQ